MYLIESNFTNISAEQSDDKKLYLKGVFMESERQNRNGREYKRAEIERAVQKVNEAAAAGRYVLGELDHPNHLTVNAENVSHKIIEMHMQGNDAIGKAEIITTVPKGQIAKGLIEAGVQLGVSSRGSGSVNESTGIVEGFEMVTVDIVINPSAINAFPESVMEHLEYFKHRNEVMNLAEAVIHDKNAQIYFGKEIKKFIESLSGKK